MDATIRRSHDWGRCESVAVHQSWREAPLADTAAIPPEMSAARRFIIRPCDACLNCAYTLTGSRHSDRCPECGCPVAAEVVDYRVDYRRLAVATGAFMAAMVVVKLALVPRSGLIVIESGIIAGCASVQIYFGLTRSTGGVAFSRHGLHFYGIWNVRRRGPFHPWGDLTHAVHKSGVVRVMGRDGKPVTGLPNITWKRNREIMTRLINLGIELTGRGEQAAFIERCRAVLEAA